MKNLFRFLSAALGAALIGAGTMLAAAKIAEKIEESMDDYNKPLLGDDDEPILDDDDDDDLDDE